jgi:hypothetical protein
MFQNFLEVQTFFINKSILQFFLFNYTYTVIAQNRTFFNVEWEWEATNKMQ